MDEQRHTILRIMFCQGKIHRDVDPQHSAVFGQERECVGIGQRFSASDPTPCYLAFWVPCRLFPISFSHPFGSVCSSKDLPSYFKDLSCG